MEAPRVRAPRAVLALALAVASMAGPVAAHAASGGTA
jgi:hypothetical protein